MTKNINWRVPLGIQSVAAQSAWAGVRLMAGYQAIAQGAGPVLLAALTTIFALPALVAAVPAGRLTDRFGGSIVSLIGALIGVVGVAGMIFLPGLPALIACCAVVGLGNLGSMVGQQTFVAHQSRGGPSEGGFGFLSATASAGQAVGPPLATVVATMLVMDPSKPDTALGFVVCAVLTAMGVPFFWMMRRVENRIVPSRTEVGSAEKTSQLSMARNVWRALAVSGLVLVTIDLLYTFMPLWAQYRGVSANIIGLLLALRAGISMFSRLGLGRMVAKWGRMRLIVSATLMASVGLLILPFAGVGWAIVSMLLLGVGLGIPQPLTMAWAVASTHERQHGMVLGLRLSANRLALIIVPLGIGALAVPLGAMSVFYVNSGLMLVSAAIAAKTPRA